jgi:hypothetical protein
LPGITWNSKSIMEEYMRMSTAIRGITVGLALVIMGGTSSYAMSYGTLTVSNGGFERGKGHGTFTSINGDQAKLTATLADLRRDDSRTFAVGRATSEIADINVESGRRTDGESNFAAMADQVRNSPARTVGWKATVRLCQDKPGLDWCTQESSASGRL